MGTSSSYSGGGGEAGNDLRDSVADWLESLPTSPSSGAEEAGESESLDAGPKDGEEEAKPSGMQPEDVAPVVGLFARRPGGRGDGPGGAGGAEGANGRPRGGGRRGGGARRSAARSASSAGRAAAAAYAYATGNADTLRELGLDYAALRASGDPIEIARQIVDAACESSSDGTIEDEERRHVAAAVALWVLEESEAGAPPEPDEIARYALAQILFEAMSSETAALLRDGKQPAWATRDGERQLRQAAEALAQTANLSPNGATATELEQAIEEGIETLRSIRGES
jgi:hypothetical protein